MGHFGSNDKSGLMKGRESSSVEWLVVYGVGAGGVWREACHGQGCSIRGDRRNDSCRCRHRAWRRVDGPVATVGLMLQG